MFLFFNKKKIRLPKYEVEHVVSTLSQVTDWGVRQLNVPETWTVTQGENKVALVIDTGCTEHPDLVDNMIIHKSKSFISYEDIYDLNGHSSHVCGIVAASDNNTGMVGVAPKAKIITCKTLDKNGSGSMKALEDALEYALELKPDVISMSLGSPIGTNKTHNLIKQLHSLNIPIICAAGNSGRDNDVHYPAKYPETITVTAFDKNGRPARFNSKGSEVDFSAPGVDIYSTWINNQYARISGTSMATPFITGIVLLLLAKHAKQELETGKNDCKTIEQIKEHLIKYADDRGAVGKDSTWGYGVIDPKNLILAANESDEEDDTEAIETPAPPPPEQECGFWCKLRKALKKIFY